MKNESNEATKLFYLDNYLDNKLGIKKENKVISINKDKMTRFDDICEIVKNYFKEDWENNEGKDKTEVLLETQKKAIIGYEREVSFFKDKIQEYLKTNNLLKEWFPEWYLDIVDAIYHENWGLAGIAEWKRIKESSSAKIIGNRIYFLINGKAVLQPQKISANRYKQLRKALLLKTPKIRLDKPYSEVHMLDGTRITIYDEGLTKSGQATIVFRDYIVDKYTFEEQARRHTIPYEIIPMLKAKVDVGYNMAAIGAVRTTKTTFLQTWQSYENVELEGIMIETSPEIPLHILMPEAPIMQLVTDGEELENLVPSILRSDADYIIMAEARNGVEFNLALEATDRGTRRSKLTTHFTRGIDFPYNMADKIVGKYGGSLYSTITKVAKNFNYVYEFIQLKNKSQKRLKAIYELRYDPITFKITIHQICKYIYESDSWVFKYDIGPDKEEIGLQEDPEAFNIFKNELERLSIQFPMEENNIFTPDYQHLRGGL